MRRLLVMLLVLAGVLCAGQGKGKGKGHEKQAPAPSGFSVNFDDSQRIIREYCRTLPPSNLPPGLAKRGGALPPGLEKQLQRNGTLPPGLAKRVQPFPPELERRLPPLATELRRGFVEGHAVIYNAKTQVILDVFIPF